MVVLKDWYSTPLTQQVDSIQISKGASLQKNQVNAMVEAWDKYEAAGSSPLAKTQLDSELNAQWAIA